MLHHSLTHLKNGLTLIRIPMQVPSVTVLALTNTGSRYEKPHQYGIAHFFEHMVFKGTAKYPTALDLAEAVDNVGADFNAFTSKEYTGYYVKAASQHLELALDVVSEMLLTPALRQEDIDREKGVIIEELNMYVDTPQRHVADVFDALMYQTSGLAHKIVGSKQTITDMTAADFTTFLKEWYGLANMVLMVVGDASQVGDAAQVETLVNKMFSKEHERRAEGAVNLDLYLEGEHGPQRLSVEERPTEQAHFVIGWPGIDRSDPRRHALSVLGNILGGSMSSRLFTEVREKRGLCYYVYADTDIYHTPGAFGASAGVDPQRLHEALKVTIDQFQQVAAGETPVTAKELQRAKDYLAGKTALGLEDSENVAQYFGLKQLLYGKVETPEEVLAQINKVTLEDVHQVAKELIQPHGLRLAVVGPQPESEFEKYVG